MARAERLGRRLFARVAAAIACVAIAAGALPFAAPAAARVETEAVRFRNYDVEDGLSHGRVSALAQDRSGYLWIGTRDGLNRFDGKRFRIYRHDAEDPDSLPDNVIMSLAIGEDGTLWIGTAGGGLARYDEERDRFQTFRAGIASGLANDYIRILQPAPGGELWVGCFGATLQRFDPRRGLARDLVLGRLPELQRVHRVLTLPDDAGFAFVVEDRLLLWDGHSTALKSLFAPQPGEVDPNLEWAVIDQDRRLWLGNLDGTLVRADLDGNVRARYRPGEGLRSGGARILLQTRSGDIWLGMSSGIARYDAANDRFVEVVNDDSDPISPPSDVLLLFEDRDGLLWAGSAARGVGMHDPASEAISVYRRRANDPISFPPGAVQAVAAAPDGTLWLGYGGGGLVHLRPGGGILRRYRHEAGDEASLASDAIAALAFGRDGSLWIGHDNHGLDRLAPGATAFRHYRRRAGQPSSLPGDLINDLYVDADDTLWVGSDGGGLGSLCGGCETFQTYTLGGDPFDLSVATVTGIAETPDRAIWFGLFGGGVARLAPDRRQVRRFSATAPPGAGPRNDVVRVVHASRDGSLWAGGSNGLDRIVYDRGSAVRFEVQPWQTVDGSSSITCIVDDDRGRLWLGTVDGLMLRDVAAAPAPRRADLLNGLDRRGYIRNACRAARGQLYLGGPHGLVVFSPAQLPSPPPIGPLVLDELLLFNAPVRPRPDDGDALLKRTLAHSERVRLGHRDAVFGFSFAALDYRSADRVRYRYRLDGLHADWIPTLPDQRSVTFSGVPAGSYRFRVQAQRDGGEPRETGVDVAIAPAPWRSGWAYAGYALLLAFAIGQVLRRSQQRLGYARHVAATIQRSEEALRRLNDELESRVAQRTADLSRSNLELQATLDQLRRAQRQLVEAEKLASLGGLVAGIAHEINTPLGVCLTAASHLQTQAAQLRTRLTSGELRRSELDEFQQAACEGSDIILRNLQRADRLVRSFKQTAVDQSSDAWRELDLEQSVRDTLVMLGPVLKTTPHRIQIDATERLFVHTSPGALYQIVSNLVLNALQHAFVAGQVGTLTIRLLRDGEEFGIDVADDGRGMDERERARVFEPFFTTRRSEGGSGLGLHIVHNLVTQVLGGRIVCASVEGRGTRFAIRWPAPRPAAKDA
ncbi:MAG TPA: two-component regulator propeller domain-containing protein [Tahibacter sp.]|uniref:two-component regulator propeller domain-containing protein n=1 Tax=Tahibacter sp. TaxID=2056211 RepID=UPI002CE838A7|nr:two-component regulator propeller domain-containing protein [Tahibacter sp.]HSX59381.1 two-component regulator propeller domain-containing protein [Tahibacter sp.]